MKSPRFVIIGPDTENTQDLKREIVGRGLMVEIVALKDVFFKLEKDSFVADWNGQDLFSFDIFIFRGYNKNPGFARTLARNLLLQGKIVLDEVVGKDFFSGKIADATMLSAAKIPHPKTYQAISSETYGKILSSLSFPIITKPVDGQKGQSVEKFDTLQEALDFFTANPKGFFIQEYVPIDGDIRVLVVDGKALGAIKRMVIPGDYRSNASLGAAAEKIGLTERMEAMAIGAARAMGYEIAGVDLIEKDGALSVLEVNITPQWQKFKEVTGINPAGHIISYAIKKYEKKQNRFF